MQSKYFKVFIPLSPHQYNQVFSKQYVLILSIFSHFTSNLSWGIAQTQSLHPENITEELLLVAIIQVTEIFLCPQQFHRNFPHNTNLPLYCTVKSHIVVFALTLGRIRPLSGSP